ncbi:MAG: glycosyltransferase family 4 protein [Bryobacteraceae bacterium]|nr:glycosyltransferase family 4 protein [Bryobacteraceae bacterium]
MRVLHLDSGREMRGGQRQVLALLEGLGPESSLLTPAEGPLMRAARARGIDAQPMSVMSIIALSRKTDLMHAHDARSHTWAATLSTAPLVVSRRVGFPVQNSILSRWKYGRASHYLAVSCFVRQALMDAEVPEQHISVVYDGVPIPEKVADGDRIVAPATEDPMKGTDLVRKAAKIAGCHVHFSSDLDEDLRSAGLLVYATRSEGLGSAALLAMAHGVPVVASRVGGLPEFVIDGENGYLTENQPELIADAILRAMEIRDTLRLRARSCVEQRFSIQHMVENTRNAYRRVL